ncbi:MAG: TRAP transporter large permease subunit [Candidatus Competibacterales bacterium]|nr:TRAP transporter large permease subunit [Candidatus Competibacterales bacterium]
MTPTPELLCLLLLVATCGLLLLGFPVAFTLAGSSLLFALLGTVLGVFDPAFLTAFPQRIFAIMTNEVLVAVPLFVFMGVMLERSRVAEELLETMGQMFGRLRGGLGISVCLVGALLAASTGIVGATVVTMGLLSLPTMLRCGYDPRLSCGAIAASGTLGQIIPPSIVLVLLGDQLSSAYQKAQFDQGIFAPDTVSVNDLFAGALLPGLLLVALYIAYLVFVAWRRPQALPALPRDPDRPRGRRLAVALLRSLIAPVALIVAVLGSILGGLASPTEAASVGAVGALMLAGFRLDSRRGWPVLLGVACLVGLLLLTARYDLRLQRSRIEPGEWWAIAAALVLSVGLAAGLLSALWRTWRHRSEGGEAVLVEVMRSTLTLSSMVFVILVGASLFSLVFRGYGGDQLITEFLHTLPGGTLTAMLLVLGVMFLLGFFLDFLEIVFIVVPIVAPILLQMEFAGELMDPVWLGVMMALVLQTSFLTPPFGFALFYLRGVAPDAIRTGQIYRGVVPFIVIQLLALAVLWWLPQLATWLPQQLYSG